MIEYESGGKKYSASYNEMRDAYLTFVYLTDDQFIARLPEIIHFACFAAWFKEMPTSWVLSDTGIIHELSHLLHFGIEGSTVPLVMIRKQFENDLKFA